MRTTLWEDFWVPASQYALTPCENDDIVCNDRKDADEC